MPPPPARTDRISRLTDRLFSIRRREHTEVGRGSLAMRPTESYGWSRSTTAHAASAASSIFSLPSSITPMLPEVSMTISTAEAGNARSFFTSMSTGKASSTGVW